MHVRTLLVLLVVVAGLVLAVRWQRGREEVELFAPPAALFEGASADRIDRIRVDNLEHSLQLLLEARPGEGWWIVDPIEAPAEGALVSVLLEALTTQRAYLVEEPDLGRLGLDPPRAVVEFEEQVDGERVQRRLEVGSNDLDGQHLFARAFASQPPAGGASPTEGRVVRTLRTFESLLDRPLDEWRTRRVLRGIDPFAVVEVHRRGSLLLPRADEPAPMELDLVSDDGWRATAPFDARLDPGAVGLVVQTAATLLASGFVDDAPVALALYGLDEPAMTLELVTADGRRVELAFAPLDSETWYGKVGSDPRVYSFSMRTVLSLAAPPEMLVERDVARLVRDRVQRITLETGERTLRFEQRDGAWTLAVNDGASAPADPARVGDLMSALERARVLALLPEVPFEGLPPERGGPVRITVEQDERVHGGELGAPHTLADGGSGVLFRRVGDRLVTLVDAGLVELARSDAGSFENRQLVLVRELDLARIELERAGLTRVYVQNDRGRWSRRGTEVEARSLAIVVDQLLSVRAAERSADDPAPELPDELTDPIRVTLVRKSGQATTYELGELEGERDAFRGPRGRSAVVGGGLHGSLRELLEAGS